MALYDNAQKGVIVDRGKTIIGMMIIVASIAALITWEKWGRDSFFADSVLVLKENVEKGTVITNDMLKEVKMKTDLPCVKPTMAKKIVGKEAVQFIHKGTPLFQRYFEEPALAPGTGKDRYLLSIPWSWLISQSHTLSRGDRAYFYVGGKFLTSAPVTAVDVESKIYEIIVDSSQAEALSGAAYRGDKMTITYN